MKIFLRLVLVFMTGVAFAQPYPTKPIRVLVAFPPGGPVDIIARLVGPKISDALGQPVVLENVGGGGGNIAAQRVAKSAPDGYTVLAHSSAYAVNPALLGDPGFNAEKDMIPIAVVARQPNLILVNADFPARTLSQLIELAKKEKLAFASPSSGTTPHLTAENLFKVPAPPSPACSAGSRRSARSPAPRPCRTSRRASCARSPCPPTSASPRCRMCRR